MLLLRIRPVWVVVLLSLTFLGPYAQQAQGQSCLRGFAGVWKTQHGSMTLTVRGNQVSGTYGGSRAVSGTVTGSVLSGTWRHPNGRWGRIRFSHDGNGKFAGNYGEKDAALRSTWWGQCSASLPGAASGATGASSSSGRPSAEGGGVGSSSGSGSAAASGVAGVFGGASTAGCAQGFAGSWSTNYGSMTLSVQGNRASGTYGSGRTLSGTISGNVFTGRWQYPNGRWGGVRFVHDGNGTFSGNWGEKDAALTSKWTGKCTTLGPVSCGAGGFSGMCAAVSGTGGTGICQNPRTEQLMNEWLSRAILPQKPGSSLRYDCWGRAVGRAATGTITANQNPDTDGRVRCDYLRDHSHLYPSTNLGTMREYLDRNLR